MRNACHRLTVTDVGGQRGVGHKADPTLTAVKRQLRCHLASQPHRPSGGEADAGSRGIGPGYAVEPASPGVARRGTGRP